MGALRDQFTALQDRLGVAAEESALAMNDLRDQVTALKAKMEGATKDVADSVPKGVLPRPCTCD